MKFASKQLIHFFIFLCFYVHNNEANSISDHSTDKKELHHQTSVNHDETSNNSKLVTMKTIDKSVTGKHQEAIKLPIFIDTLEPVCGPNGPTWLCIMPNNIGVILCNKLKWTIFAGRNCPRQQTCCYRSSSMKTTSQVSTSTKATISSKALH